jgi:hypothetical protein
MRLFGLWDVLCLPGGAVSKWIRPSAVHVYLSFPAARHPLIMHQTLYCLPRRISSCFLAIINRWCCLFRLRFSASVSLLPLLDDSPLIQSSGITRKQTHQARNCSRTSMHAAFIYLGSNRPFWFQYIPSCTAKYRRTVSSVKTHSFKNNSSFSVCLYQAAHWEMYTIAGTCLECL